MKKNILMLAVSFGIGLILHWISIIISYKETINTAYFAKGGFPISVFYYPFPAKGGDFLSVSSWQPFFLHLLFWWIIGAIILFLFPTIKNNKKVQAFIFSISITLSILGYFYILYHFD